MIGLIAMACRLADRRTGRDTPERFGIAFHNGSDPIPREDALRTNPDGSEQYPASAEYYRIIDRLTRGEAP